VIKIRISYKFQINLYGKVIKKKDKRIKTKEKQKISKKKYYRYL